MLDCLDALLANKQYYDKILTVINELLLCVHTLSVVHEYDYLHYVTMHAKSETDVAYLEDCTRIQQVLILKLSMSFNFMFLIF